VNPFGHIDLRVRDLAAAERYYGELLPALGFTRTFHSDKWKVWAAEEPPLPWTPYVGVTESAEHVPNENRIAFAVGSRDGVERIAAIVGATPKEMPYGPGYYAIFFEDPSGNRLEVYHRPG
jgi:catechol 2,3-dioxygenase-like lactoylglutathione lyase family enzyme